MKEALQASCSYLGLLCQRLREGTGRGPELIPAKRRLETANSRVFASLQANVRRTKEPGGYPAGRGRPGQREP